MIALDRLRRALERFLEIWVVFLVSALTVIVVLAVIWRKAGASFVWYDEVASIICLRGSPITAPPSRR